MLLRPSSSAFWTRASALEARLFNTPTGIPLLGPWSGQVYQSPAARRVSAQTRAMAAQAAPNVVVYVTVPNKETGTKLASSIVTNKLAACVNQIPGIESTYWWQGKVETDSEVLLMIKTKSSLLEELTTHVIENHPYDVPEVIALPIVAGNPGYLKWIEESTK